MSGQLMFLIIPNKKPRERGLRNAMVHVKTHFSYSPDEDPHIPCPELGIAFQKGDILHVVSQDDPHWWQAYREGEDDQPLAGLIPSKGLQLQRKA
ncbi:PREDICTED: MAGUK p55 subfamily member 5-A-like [Priapulus caudatus]|uniref:MAGUK p55 subfamily member 5-A-like n=1 Tax=Priapulus caudatus TaxID=37621 RepID=A0ABM1ETS6_PRICU|nr:PREDICTED: MAGUK p55 subfamily member 5-A-like [Priapulus caudatus]